jgi:C4-dicarboxylate-binding protein DctP
MDSLKPEVRDEFLKIVAEVSADRNAASAEVNQEAKASIIAAGGKVVELDAEQRAAWVAAMKPVWAEFEGDVGAENIEAAQKINEALAAK